jgi:hypothetical protein
VVRALDSLATAYRDDDLTGQIEPDRDDELLKARMSVERIAKAEDLPEETREKAHKAQLSASTLRDRIPTPPGLGTKAGGFPTA